MKYIEKKIGNEPKTLKSYRDTTPEASFKGFTDTNHLLKKALLAEQGHICAYCMQRISLKLNAKHKPRIEVEHILSQENHPYKSLDYTNMVGVCNGNLGGKEHCDKSKKDKELNIIFPHKNNCEELLTYSTSGKILSKSNIPEVERDLNEILNLNNQNLIDNRKAAVDLVIENLSKKYEGKRWTKKQIEEEIQIYENRDSKGRFKEFCKYIIWYLYMLKAKPKYKL